MVLKAQSWTYTWKDSKTLLTINENYITLYLCKNQICRYRVSFYLFFYENKKTQKLDGIFKFFYTTAVDSK